MTIEVLRRANARDRVLTALQARRRISNADLIEIGGFRAGARIFELRKQGYRIRTEPGQGGLFWFVYEGAPLPPHDGRLPL